MVMLYFKKKYLFFFLVIYILLTWGCVENRPMVIVENIDKLPDKMDFNFHVKPILSDKCFACHGPDSKKRKANLRLDINENAATKSNEKTLTINDIKSSLIKRLTSDDPEIRMPPPDFHLSLTEKEIATIIKWVDQGAKYQNHWSFLPLIDKPLPKLDKSEQLRNEIDYFIQKKLERNGFKQASKASPENLIRRLSFTLKGLPPELKEVEIYSILI